MILGEGKNGQVVDNFDGTVTKALKNMNELNISEILKNFKLRYIANYLGDTATTIVKEKIEQSDKLVSDIKKLEHYWDISLIQSHNLFDFINRYLCSDNTMEFKYVRSTITFFQYLKSLDKKLTPLFLEFVELIQELKDNNIHSVDWNEENFGLRHNHLALFELGGAKIKL